MQIGWIDFSKDERNKVLSVIHLLEEQGTIDELGIGAIRDAFADCFFPGTSTVQTRAKYFLVVPYILKEACSGEYGSNVNSIIRRIDLEERRCRDIFLKSSKDGDGVIGSLRPGSWVQRPPSSIYWNGLKRLGIVTENLSLRDLIAESLIINKDKKAREYGNRNLDSEENERDDMDAGDITHIRLLDIGDVYKSDWRDRLTIDLEPDEAEFLKSHIIDNQHDTLFAYFLDKKIPVEEYDSFAAISADIIDSVDADMAEKIKLANDFNGLVSIITTRFNMIVSKGQNDNATYRWEMLSNDLKQRSTVDLKRIYSEFDIKPRLRVFLNNVQEAIMAEDIELVDKLIILREIHNKDNIFIHPDKIEYDPYSYSINLMRNIPNSRAKTMHAGNYPTDSWIGLGELDYRFTPARRIIRDIMNAEDKENV